MTTERELVNIGEERDLEGYYREIMDFFKQNPQWNRDMPFDYDEVIKRAVITTEMKIEGMDEPDELISRYGEDYPITRYGEPWSPGEEDLRLLHENGRAKLYMTVPDLDACGPLSGAIYYEIKDTSIANQQEAGADTLLYNLREAQHQIAENHATEYLIPSQPIAEDPDELLVEARIPADFKRSELIATVDALGKIARDVNQLYENLRLMPEWYSRRDSH